MNDFHFISHDSLVSLNQFIPSTFYAWAPCGALSYPRLKVGPIKSHFNLPFFNGYLHSNCSYEFKDCAFKTTLASSINVAFTFISWSPKVLNLITFLTTLSQVVALYESL
jgi:hypothetical protein